MILLVSGATVDVAGTDADRVGVLLVPGTWGQTVADGRYWAGDNGSFSGFDAAAFVRLLVRHQGRPRCLFVAAPDVVGDHARTLTLFESWVRPIREMAYPVAFVAQNGCTARSVPWAHCDAVFIGGDTTFKLSRDVDAILEQAERLGKWSHVGRVNTRRRLRHFCGRARSFDGSGFSKWPKRIRLAMLWLTEQQQQPGLI